MRIYLDHNATTPLHPEVLAARTRVIAEVFGNPSSTHGEGAAARAELERARGRVARLVNAAPGEIVFTPVPTPQSVYLLEKGLVRIYRLSEKGSEATFGYVQPGEIFGELSAISELARESYAEAAAPSVVWHLPIEQFRRFLGSRPGVGRNVSQQLADRLRRIERRVEGLIFHDARLRLAVIVNELAEHFGVMLQLRSEVIVLAAVIFSISRDGFGQCLAGFPVFSSLH